jgi:hypothetical protein
MMINTLVENNHSPSQEGVIPESLKNKILQNSYKANWKKHFDNIELNILKNNIKHFESIVRYCELRYCIKNNIFDYIIIFSCLQC